MTNKDKNMNNTMKVTDISWKSMKNMAKQGIGHGRLLKIAELLQKEEKKKR